MNEIDTARLELLLHMYVYAVRELRSMNDDAVAGLIARLERLLLAAEAELAARAAHGAHPSFVPEPAPGLP